MDRLAKNLDTDELKVAFAFLLSMPGAPFIYYGDEIGMRYVEGLTSVEGGYGRTGSRTPMQWDDSLSAGFQQLVRINIILLLMRAQTVQMRKRSQNRKIHFAVK